jgi:tetratricopeptide (TPR) repeat protein
MVHPATTLHHLSLLEYLQAPTTEASFAISTFDSHSAISLTCLELLSTLQPSSFDGNSRLRALQRYAVKYWPHHAFNGTPRLNEQWSQTEHCSTLQKMSDIHGRWAALFLRGFMPGEVDSMLEDAKEDDSMGSTLRKLGGRLGKAGGEHWGFQVACLEVAVRIDGGDAEAWSDLGRCYYTRGDQTGNLRMHEEAVVAFRQALSLWPDPHPSCGDSFDDVGRALRSCYRQNGNLNILNEAILCFRMAVTLSPTPHPDRARYLGNLTNALKDLYYHDGDLSTLDEAISLLREVLALHPAPHPFCPWSLDSLASALGDLYQRNGDIKTLDEAILLHRKALALRPPSNKDRPTSLTNLARVLKSLYQHNEDLDIFNEVISLENEALGLRPAPHPKRSISLNNLAESLFMLYQHDKAIGTLNQCISLGCEALALRPAPHPERHLTLCNLARVYLSQFEQKQNGAVEVLDEAISLAREWPVLCRPGHRRRAEYLEFLVRLLKSRREFTGDDRDCGEIEDWEAELEG